MAVEIFPEIYFAQYTLPLFHKHKCQYISHQNIVNPASHLQYYWLRFKTTNRKKEWLSLTLK